MNALQFVDLIHEIFGSKPANLDKIQAMGLLAVKIAQTFALRIDFLDEERCMHLAQLFNHVDAIAPEAIEQLIAKYESPQWMNNFKQFDHQSIASASIGQVHKAQLESGESVAVKIIKHQFKEAFEKDVEVVLKLFKAALFFYPKLGRVADPIGTLNSLRQFTLDELDLRIEARHKDLLAAIQNDHGHLVDLSGLKFPHIYKELSSENIMVSEYIEGQTFDTLLDEKKLPYQRLLDLFHIHGFYVFGVGTFHGDIHPGNIILSGEKLVFVDCGAIGRVKEPMRKGLFKFMEALSYYEFKDCAHWLHSMSDKTLNPKAYDAFLEKFLHLYSDFTGKTVSQVSLTEKMMATIKLGVHSGMVFEQGMYPIIKSLMYLDGMVLKCKPDTVLMEDMRPFVKELNAYMS